MEEPQWTVTRREILKRGAIVGGGVLWITPVVRTIGMGRAFAAPVSGAEPCWTLEMRSCTSAGSTYAADFWAHIGPGCACNPLLSTHQVHLRVNGASRAIMTDAGSGWYKAVIIPVTIDDVAVAVCFDTETNTVESESAGYVFTSAIAGACWRLGS